MKLFIREPEEFFFETLYDLNRDFAELVPGDVAHLLRISATILQPGWAAIFHGYVLHEAAGGRAMVKHQFVTGILVMMTALHGCGGGARPYGAMHKAAESELSASAQARDHRLKMELRTTLISEKGLAGLTLTPDVFMERGYVTGRVETPDQADAVRRIAHSVEGLRSVEVYLPVTQAQSTNESNLASDLALKAEVASALKLAPGIVAARITTAVLDGHVVLLGVVSDEEERRRVAAAVAGVDGVKGVTNWLLLPESDYKALRPKLR